MKPITQEMLMGCAIACSASLANLSYKQMRRYFDDSKVKEKTLGFYNRDIVNALNKIGIQAKSFSAKRWGKIKIKPETIVFIKASDRYPVGHYLLKTKDGWMNPWINCPNITPAKSGFHKRLPGKISWVIKTSNSKTAKEFVSNARI